jgi:hypothetical protein
MNRRQLLAGGLAGAALPQSSKKTVAAIVTMYTNDGRLNTHANVIIGRLLNGYSPKSTDSRSIPPFARRLRSAVETWR